MARTWDWLAEQPEDAAELAVLLYEAAPKLNIAASAGGASHHAAKTPRRAAYSEEGGLRERLAAAVPMPTGAPAPAAAASHAESPFHADLQSICACPGPGEVDWRQLVMVVGSEMLHCEPSARHGDERDSHPHHHPSPRGAWNPLCCSINCFWSSMFA